MILDDQEILPRETQILQIQVWDEGLSLDLRNGDVNNNGLKY